jgi:hypothetical protein
VPATLIDLTTHGAEGTANGAIFRQFDVDPEDTTGMKRFLAIKDNGVEQGYNTDADQQPGDGNADLVNGKAIRLSSVPLVEVDGVAYRAFFLDVNEPDGSPLISLDEMRLYVHNTRFLTGYNGATKTLGGKSAVWDMDGAGDVFVRLDDGLNDGLGRGDAYVFVPNSAFDGVSDSTFVYLYSKFGVHNPANGGAERWGRKPPPADEPPPAEGASLSLRVVTDNPDGGIAGEADSTDAGLAGIVVNLLDSNGLVIDSQTTDSDGFVTFANLAAGTYGIEMVTPPEPPSTQLFPMLGASDDGDELDDGEINPSWTGFTGIVLSDGETASGYIVGIAPSEGT